MQIAEVTVGTRNSHIRVRWRFIDDILNDVAAGHRGRNRRENSGGLLFSGIASSGRFRSRLVIRLRVSGSGVSDGRPRAGEGQRRQVAHELCRTPRVWGRNALIADVSGLHDLRILHGIGMDIVNASHGRTTHFHKLRVKDAGEWSVR